MARIRSVHPDVCLDETLVDASPRAERTFVRLWTHLDDEGRCVDNPRLIKAALYPLHDDMTASEVDDDLEELAELGIVIRYEVDGKRVLSAKVESWKRYQKPRHPQESKLPPIPTDCPPRTALRRNAPALGGASCRGVVGGVDVGVGGGVGEGEPPPAMPSRAFARAPITAEEELAVGAVLAEYVNLKEERAGRLGNPNAWRAAVLKSARVDHEATIRRWLTEFDVTAREMAAALIDGAPGRWNDSRRVPA